METLLHVGLSNALLATALAVLAAACGRVCRRPALIHFLWVLVLLKLVTPPFVPVPVTLPALFESARAGLPASPRTDSGDLISKERLSVRATGMTGVDGADQRGTAVPRVEA